MRYTEGRGHYLWNHFSDVINFFSDFPYLVSCPCLPFSHLFYGSVNICGRFVDLFLLILHGHFYGGRFGTNLLQKSLCRVKLGGEGIPVFLVSGGRRRLEMREKVFLII